MSSSSREPAHCAICFFTVGLSSRSHVFRLFLTGLALVFVCLFPAVAQPLKIHPSNSRIFEFKGEPTVLRTYGEFYGSVFNQGFNYIPYLDKLQQDGMNLTRVILIGFHGDTGDANDTVNPSAANYLQPWPRSTAAGNAQDGLGKWDFSQWSTAYFTRLRAFIQACSDRGIVVELTLFSTCYNNSQLQQWEWTPFNRLNNVQNIGPSTGSTPWFDTVRPTVTALFTEQREVVRRIVEEVNPYDNIYFEIQNEPFWNEVGVKDAEEVVFHNTMLSEIRNKEATLPKRHLVTHNFPQQINNLTNDFDIINTHYPFAVPSTPIIGGENLLRDFYVRNRALSLDETTTAGPTESRLESWMFLLGGGAIYNGLDQGSNVYSMSSPSGTAAPGPAIRTSLRNLGNYMNSLDLLGLRRDLSWLVSGAHASSRRQGMSKPGQQYVMYFYHGSFSLPYQTVYSPIDSSNHTAALRVNLPAGSYRAAWTKPSNMSSIAVENFTHSGGERVLQSVTYQEDAVLRIDRTGSGDTTAPPPPGGLSATINAQNQILLNWSAASAADLASYRIFRYTGTGTPVFPGTPLTTVTSGTLSYVDASAAQGSQHRYVVTAVDDQGNESRRSSIALAVAPITLTPPIAAAGTDQTIFDTDQNLSENITLNGGASQPGARPIVSYVWRVNGSQIATGVNPTVSLSTGIRDVELTVTDDVGLTASDVVRVSISNTEFRNGSFENSLTGPFPAGTSNVLLTGLSGWTVNLESNPVKSDASYVPRDGTATVLIFGGANKVGGSSITQTFPTVPGRTYNVDIDMGVVAFNTSSQILTAQIRGATLQTLQTFSQTGVTSGGNSGKLVWRSTAPSFSFVADSSVSSLTLRDASTATSGLDMIIDNVRVLAQGDRTLTLGSQPTSGLAFTVTPTDLNGAGGGSTPFSRNFGNGTTVAVTAPAISNGQGFIRWMSNGVDIGSANPINLTLASNVTLTAIYGDGPPVILAQPLTMVRAVGDSAVFSVEAAGTGTLSYQWRFNQVPIDGAEGSSYTIASVTGLSAGTYDVLVTSPGGTTTSQSALLSVPVPHFINGSFEDGLDNLDGWIALGSTAIQGTSADYIPVDGDHLIAFNSGNTTPSGSISQSFATTPGVVYQVIYSAKILAYTNDTQTLRLEVTGNSLLRAKNLVFSRVTPTPAGAVPNSLVWQDFSESFTADSTLTMVKFLDLSTKTNSIDLLLDHVRIVAQSPAQFPGANPLTALAQSLATSEDVVLPIVLSSSGGSGGMLVYQVLSGPVNGNLNGTAPNLTFMPNANFHGVDSFTFTVSDGTASPVQGTVNITVNPVNDPPLAIVQALGTNEDTALSITLGGSDVDGGSLTYAISGEPANGELIGTAPNLTYTPDENFHGSDSFTFTVSDGTASPVQGAVSITVNPVNDPPLAIGQALGTNEDTALSVTLGGSDVDGGSLTYAINGEPANGDLTGTAPNLTYTPDENFHGSDSFTFTVSDGTASPVQGTVSITVNPVNDPPLAIGQALGTNEDTALSITLGGNDVDGGSLTYAISGGPANGDVTGTAPNLTYTPDENFHGSDSFTFTVSDGIASPVQATITIAVSPVNDPPVANAQSLGTAEDTQLAVTLTGSDVEGDGLLFVITGDPANGELSGTVPNLTYTPDENYHGADSITFTVSDGIASPVQATVSITVNPANDPPLANAQSLGTAEDTQLAVTLTGSDVEGDTLLFVITGDPANGELGGTVPNLTYTPDENYHGADSITFTVSDGIASPVQATVSIAVSPVNDPPLANAQSLTIEKNTPSAMVLSGSDVDGDSLTYQVTAGPAHGVLSGDAPSLTYTPHANYFGPDSISFAVGDGIADPVEASIEISVAAVDEPLPVLRIERLESACRITLTPQAAGDYRVEWSDELEDWELVEERVVSESGEIEIIDATATGDRRFYRASRKP